MKIGFPVSTKKNENRRAIIPDDLAKIKNADKLVFEKGYGDCLGFSDDDYKNCGVQVADRQSVCSCDFICNPKPVLTDEYFQQGKTIFGWIHAVQGRKITDLLIDNKMTAIAWEDLFEKGRHLLWRNNELSGEAAIMHAFVHWGKVPYEASVAVIGKGNVARGAIRTLERFGCRTTVYDRKTSSLLRDEVHQFDVIVNAVLWDVFRTDHLIYEEDLSKMKPGSMIIDISCDEAMGIQTSHSTTIDEPTYVYRGIVHYAVDHTPALVYKSSSKAISSIISTLIDSIVDGEKNPVIEGATIIKDGNILDDRIKRFQKR